MKDYERLFIDKCRISIQKQKFGNMTNCTIVDRRKFLGDPLYVAKIETDSDKTFWGIGNESDQGFYSYPASGSSTAFSSYVGELVQKTPHLITNYTEPPRGGKKYNAFIIHAWTDKVNFVKHMVDNLINRGFSCSSKTIKLRHVSMFCFWLRVFWIVPGPPGWLLLTPCFGNSLLWRQYLLRSQAC